MLKENKIISVVTIEESRLAVDLAKCLFDSGIRNLEITLRTKEAKKAIELILNTDLDLKIGLSTWPHRTRWEEKVSKLFWRGSPVGISDMDTKKNKKQ